MSCALPSGRVQSVEKPDRISIRLEERSASYIPWSATIVRPQATRVSPPPGPPQLAAAAHRIESLTSRTRASVQPFDADATQAYPYFVACCSEWVPLFEMEDVVARRAAESILGLRQSLTQACLPASDRNGIAVPRRYQRADDCAVTLRPRVSPQ